MTFEEFYAQAEKATETEKNNAISAKEKQWNTTIDTTKKTYEQQIKDTEQQYNGQYRSNYVQRLINERQIAESLDNLGLKKSGISSTNQTAIQLSYANNKAKIDIAKQKAVDTLANALADKVTIMESDKNAEIQGIHSSYAELNSKQATEMYKTEQTNTTNKYIAEQEADAKIKAAQYEAEKNASDNLLKQEQDKLDRRDKAFEKLIMTLADSDASAEDKQKMLDAYNRIYPTEQGGTLYLVSGNVVSEEDIADAALKYHKEHPKIAVDSRTIDYWLNDNGYHSGESTQLFKKYLAYYGAPTKSRN